MKTTGNLGLKKPDGTDIVDITDLNGNMDILDTAVKTAQDHAADAVKHITAAERTAWNAKASTSVATTTAAGLMAGADKSKLDSVAQGANNYVHPSTHSPSVIVQDSSNRFVTDAEKTAWNGKANLVTTPQQTTADITYYVRTDGNDGNTGLANTAGGAFRTIQKAISMLPQLCNHQILINVAAGTYAENVSIDNFKGRISLQAGNTAVGETNVQSITFSRCLGRLEANGFTGTSNTVSAFAALYSQQVIFTTCWTTAGASQNAVEFTFSSGRVQGGSYSNRANAIVAAWGSNIYVNEVGGREMQVTDF